jgi:uncharacterized protein (TIGR02118 family)
MATTLLVQYKPPADAETFEKRYLTEHLTILDRYEGMRNARFYRLARPLAGESPYTHTFIAEWDSKDAMMADISSDAGKEALANAVDIAPQGFDVVVLEQLSR